MVEDEGRTQMDSRLTGLIALLYPVSVGQNGTFFKPVVKYVTKQEGARLIQRTVLSKEIGRSCKCKLMPEKDRAGLYETPTSYSKDNYSIVSTTENVRS